MMMPMASGPLRAACRDGCDGARENEKIARMPFRAWQTGRAEGARELLAELGASRRHSGTPTGDRA